MNLRAFYFLLLSTFCLFTLKVESSENEHKIYVCSENLQVTNHGLFLYDHHEGYIPVKAVFSDDDGLYIVDEIESIRGARREESITDKCRNEHKIWCFRCGGCAVPVCKFRCKCVEWPVQ